MNSTDGSESFNKPRIWNVKANIKMRTNKNDLETEMTQHQHTHTQTHTEGAESAMHVDSSI